MPVNQANTNKGYDSSVICNFGKFTRAFVKFTCRRSARFYSNNKSVHFETVTTISIPLFSLLITPMERRLHNNTIILDYAP